MQFVSKSSKSLFLLVVRAALVSGVGVWLLGCGRGGMPTAADAKEKILYTCGMHPEVIQDHPGNCPICGMKLTPIRKQDPIAATAGDSTITVDSATTQNMNLRTAIVTNGPLRRTVRSVGVVDFDET